MNGQEILRRAGIVDALTRIGLVAPVPPHEPEPHPDEPVYDYVPLGDGDYDAAGIGRWSGPDWTGPDPVVFGRVPRVGP